MTNLIDWLLSALLILILGVQTYLVVIGFLIFFDAMLGVITLRLREAKFSFTKFFGGLANKVIFYTPAIVALYLLDVFIIGDIVAYFVPIEHLVTKVGTMVLVGKELASINKFIKVLRGVSFTESISRKVKYLKDFKDETKDLFKRD